MVTIFNELFFGSQLTAGDIAQTGQYVENVYFGKPCGLMDQTASSVGSMVFIDFENLDFPSVERIDFDFEAAGHTLCIIDSGADHADLTDEYAAIPRGLKAVCAYFDKEVLRDIPEEFLTALPKLRHQVPDRAVMRTFHVYQENKRVKQLAVALQKNDFEEFLSIVSASSRSSWMYLQNINPAGAWEHQGVAFTLALCDTLLDGRGACRIHSGGFVGTVQAFVPMAVLDGFKIGIDAVLGELPCAEHPPVRRHPGEVKGNAV